MTIDELKRAVRMTTDEQGEPAILIPLNIWEDYLAEIGGEAVPQHIRIKQSLQKMRTIPNDKPEEWWGEFDTFLRENRFSIPERDLGLGDE